MEKVTASVRIIEGSNRKGKKVFGFKNRVSLVSEIEKQRGEEERKKSKRIINTIPLALN